MDRRELLDKAAQDAEERLLLSRVWDKREQCRQRNIPAATDFLSPQEQAAAQRLLDGVRGHQSLQSVPDPDARNEAPVSFTVEGERIVLTVYGRIDRLYGLSVVEEIKTTLDAAPEDALPLHWAQAECYAFMLCEKEGLSHIDVRITYLNLSSGEVTRFTRSLTHAVLAERFYGYVRPYLAHLDELAAHRAREMGYQPYYLYRQKYMAGNLENVGYAKPGKACLYNIGNMEETASVLALGAGAITKWLFPRERRIERAPNVRNIEQYIDRAEEMADRKRTLIMS